MKSLSAQQLQLAAIDPAQAFGPDGILTTIAGHECRVSKYGIWTVVTVGEEVHEFQGCSKEEIEREMILRLDGGGA